MIVVCNTSPLSNLAAIGRLDILEKLYAKVYIPEAVRDELIADTSPERTSRWALAKSWVDTIHVIDRYLVDWLSVDLDLGEAETLALGLQIKSDLAIIDEREGSETARRLGLRTVGLIGMLLEAKKEGVILAVRPILDDLIAEAGFWISVRLYNDICAEVSE